MAYRFRGLVHYHHGTKHGSIHTDMELDELRALRLYLKAAEGDCVPHQVSKPTPTVTHILQQGHTYSNKATSPNSATPYGLSMQTHESMGAIPRHCALAFHTQNLPSDGPVTCEQWQMDFWEDRLSEVSLVKREAHMRSFLPRDRNCCISTFSSVIILVKGRSGTGGNKSHAC